MPSVPDFPMISNLSGLLRLLKYKFKCNPKRSQWLTFISGKSSTIAQIICRKCFIAVKSGGLSDSAFALLLCSFEHNSVHQASINIFIRPKPQSFPNLHRVLPVPSKILIMLELWSGICAIKLTYKASRHQWHGFKALVQEEEEEGSIKASKHICLHLLYCRWIVEN